MIQPIPGESPLELQRKARTTSRPSVREQLTSRNSTTPIPDEVQEPAGQPSLAAMEQLSGTESTVEGNTDILDMEQTEQTFSNFDSVCNGESQSTETATQDETIEKKPSIRERLAEARSPFCPQKEIQIGKKQDKELAL